MGVILKERLKEQERISVSVSMSSNGFINRIIIAMGIHSRRKSTTGFQAVKKPSTRFSNPTTIRTVLSIALGQGWQITVYVNKTPHLRHSWKWMRCGQQAGITSLHGLTSSFPTPYSGLDRVRVVGSKWASPLFARRLRCFRVKIEDLQTA